ncbi:hypothetical protein KY317_04130 [Candidatus Woesearchaeota archaeon]|nr:hypothetical protein [Candidatus Woesearchaeota archaeon]
MGLFNKGKKENQRYAQIREQIRTKAIEQAQERGINIPSEPIKIAEATDISGKREYYDYLDIANFLLAEYPTELGFYVANAFTNLASRLGYDPFGKIMLAVQYTDKLAGSPIITRVSFIQEHPEFYKFMTEKDCPERTDKALDFLAAAVFQFKDAGAARKVFPTLFPVPELEEGVKEKLYSIDQMVAKYIIQ